MAARMKAARRPRWQARFQPRMAITREAGIFAFIATPTNTEPLRMAAKRHKKRKKIFDESMSSIRRPR